MMTGLVPAVFSIGAQAATFAPPVLLEAGGKPVMTESPGYASPTWADLDGDGVQDLLVGQFRHGKIRVYQGLAGGKLAPGKWLDTREGLAKVPGVW